MTRATDGKSSRYAATVSRLADTTRSLPVLKVVDQSSGRYVGRDPRMRSGPLDLFPGVLFQALKL